MSMQRVVWVEERITVVQTLLSGKYNKLYILVRPAAANLAIVYIQHLIQLRVEYYGICTRRDNMPIYFYATECQLISGVLDSTAPHHPIFTVTS